MARPAEVAYRLAKRARTLAVVLFIGAVLAGTLSFGWMSPPGSGYFFFVLAVLAAVVAVGSARNAVEVEKAGSILEGISDLRVTKAQGIFLPRTWATVAVHGENAPPLDLRYQGSLILESVAMDARFILRLPWGSPIDVDLTRDRKHTPPSPIDMLLDEIRTRLPAGDIFRVIREEAVLASFVRPDWGHVIAANEPADAVRGRILERWLLMNQVRKAAGDASKAMSSLL